MSKAMKHVVLFKNRSKIKQSSLTISVYETVISKAYTIAMVILQSIFQSELHLHL